MDFLNKLAKLPDKEIIKRNLDDLYHLQFKGHIIFEEELNDINKIDKGSELNQLKDILDILINFNYNLLSLWLPNNFNEIKDDLGNYITTINDHNDVIDISTMDVDDLVNLVKSSISEYPNCRYFFIIYRKSDSSPKQALRYCYNNLSTDFKFNKYYNGLDF